MQALSEDWAQEDKGHSSFRVTRLHLIAVAASLCLHLVLLAVGLRYGSIEFQQLSPPTVSVGLVPINPLLEEASEELAVEEPVSEAFVEESQPEVQEEDIPLTAEQPVQTIPEQSLAEASEPAEPAESEIVEVAPIAVPSVLTIQDSVRQEREQQAIGARDWTNTCSELQQVVGTLGCQKSSEPDYQAATISPQRQSVYEFHNPVVERSRSVETSPVIASQTRELAASLALNNIPAGLSEYLMAEVEAGISLYSRQGNLALQNMDIMVERSAAAQIAREINSPWVQLATRQQQARRYLNRQDRQQSEECQSALLLIFTPEEIAKCLGEGHFGVILTPLNFSFDIDY